MRRSLAFGLVIAAVAAIRAGAIDPLAEADASSSDAIPPSATPTPMTVTPPSVDTIERTCALLTSCRGLPLPSPLAGPAARDVEACSEQMDNALSRPDALLFSLTLRECALTATSCDALRTCALRGVHGDACAGRGKAGPVGFCDEAGRAVTCLHGEVSGVRDCPRGNEDCSASGGTATCTLGSCPNGQTIGGMALCSASGNHRLVCDGSGHLSSVDCSAFGLSCVAVDASQGGVGCAPPRPASPACAASASGALTDDGTAEIPLRCEGTVAIGCVRGRETRVDCGAAGMVYNDGPGPVRRAAVSPAGDLVGYCMVPNAALALDGGDAGDACHPGASHCDGNAVISCVGGRSRFLSCESVGLTRCVHDARGTRCR